MSVDAEVQAEFAMYLLGDGEPATLDCLVHWFGIDRDCLMRLVRAGKLRRYVRIVRSVRTRKHPRGMPVTWFQLAEPLTAQQ